MANLLDAALARFYAGDACVVELATMRLALGYSPDLDPKQQETTRLAVEFADLFLADATDIAAERARDPLAARRLQKVQEAEGWGNERAGRMLALEAIRAASEWALPKFSADLIHQQLHRELYTRGLLNAAKLATAEIATQAVTAWRRSKGASKWTALAEIVRLLQLGRTSGTRTEGGETKGGGLEADWKKWRSGRY